jgi:aspartate kinase
MFNILGDNSINIYMISTSPIRVSCVINSNDIQKALDVLHGEFIEK